MVQSPNGRGIVICGEVNAKNSYGGYNGFEGFFVAGDIAMIDQNNLQAYWYGTAYLNYCDGGTRLLKFDKF